MKCDYANLSVVTNDPVLELPSNSTRALFVALESDEVLIGIPERREGRSIPLVRVRQAAFGLVGVLPVLKLTFDTLE
jgi:hypothetical protein